MPITLASLPLRPPARLASVLLGVSLLLGSATAQSTGAAAPDYSQMPGHFTDHVTLAADASYDEDYESNTIIRDQTDLQNKTTKVRSFISSLQQVTVAETYIIRPDGSHVPVSQDHVFIKDAPSSQGYADFGDNKIVQVLFPGVSVGDRLYVRWHIHSAAVFPGRYSALEEADITGHPYTSELTVDAPKALNLQAKARGLVHLAQKDLGDRIEFTLTDSLDTNVPTEVGAECPCDYAGAGSISNFTSWSDVAKAYRDRAADKATVTPEIQHLSDQLVGDRKGLDAVRAIDAWVRENVRYVQVYLDAGGYIPHTAGSVLKNRYGDCKDYVTLSQALMKAAGIDSEPVLVGTMARYQELPVPGPEQFNHAILYVPSLKLYLDPTNRFAPIASYQDGLFDKPVLQTTTEKLVNFQSATSGYEQHSEYTLLSDGTLNGTSSIQVTGAMDSSVRNAFSGVTPDKTTQVLQNVLTQHGEAGIGTLDIVKPFNGSDGPSMKASWTTKDLFIPDDIVSLKLPVGFAFLSFDGYKNNISLEQRRTPFVAGILSAHKTVTIHLPSSLTVLKLPKNVQADTPALSYRINYRQEGDVIFADQEIDLKQNVIQPEQYSEYRSSLLTAIRAVNAPILLQKR